MSSVVLDASVALAIMHGEEGHERGRRYLVGAAISAVTYYEVLKKAVERGSDLQLAASTWKTSH